MYFENVIKANERKFEKRRRIKRSQSGDLSSISPTKPSIDDISINKENISNISYISNISNFCKESNENKETDNRGLIKLKRQKSATKKMSKVPTHSSSKKCNGGFLMKNAVKQNKK